jgi:hypothetical protein
MNYASSYSAGGRAADLAILLIDRDSDLSDLLQRLNGIMHPLIAKASGRPDNER